MEMLGAYAMKRVAAGAHLPTPRLFGPEKRLDDRADYCQDCSSLLFCKHQILVFTLEWIWARLVGEQWAGLGPMSIPSEVTIISLA